MKIRIKFSKKGTVRYIGHLDIMRYFQKAIRRSGLDIAYTNGFHKHQILSFAAPLGVGLESSGEYMDAEFNSFPGPEAVCASLNKEMAEGIEILSAIQLPDTAKNAMSQVAAADYIVRFPFWEGLQEDLERFLALESIVVSKTTKNGETEIDIRPIIYEMKITELPGSIDSAALGVDVPEGAEASYGGIFMKLSSGSRANLKPELVLNTFAAGCGHTAGEFSSLTERLEMYAEVGGRLVPLSEAF
ncbi:MAG: TIGR03936 family radical SAM-associated protein [Lachnospiraceae bacterium]|nr:TIGR03936 family radical SAM-associated protein [Lachnospiraceae bacterium]